MGHSAKVERHCSGPPFLQGPGLEQTPGDTYAGSGRWERSCSRVCVQTSICTGPVGAHEVPPCGEEDLSPPASLLQPLWLLGQGSGHLSDEGGQPPGGIPRDRAMRGQPGLRSAFRTPSGPHCMPTFLCHLPALGTLAESTLCVQLLLVACGVDPLFCVTPVVLHLLLKIDRSKKGGKMV